MNSETETSGKVPDVGKIACGKPGCTPGTCASPGEGCFGTRLLDYRGADMEGFGKCKVPVEPRFPRIPPS